MSRQIGSVEIKRARVYHEDPYDPASRQVTVQPAIFPLMRSGDRIWWRMRGRVSTRLDSFTESLGDGLFALTPARDELSDEQVSFTSRTFTPHELDELTRELGFTDGPDQRVAIKLFAPLAAPSAGSDTGTGGR